MSVALTTAPGTVNLAKNPVYVKFQSSSYSSLENYRVVLKVLFESSYDSGTFTEIVETEAIPDGNDECTFDLSDVLQRAMERTMTFQVPDIATGTPYVSDTLRKFKIEYFEKYGTPQVEQSSTTSVAYKVLYGGVDSHYFGLYDFFDNVDDTNAFLGYPPDKKRIARDQPEYLTYLQHDGTASNSCFIRVKQYNHLGILISTFDKWKINLSYQDPIGPAQYQPAVFPTGPTELGVASTAYKYTVQIFHIQVLFSGGTYTTTGSETQGSQEYTYYIDNDIQATPHDLVWMGGFNQPNILRCRGRKRSRLTVDRLLSERIASYGYDPTTQATVQHRRDFNTHLTYRTGELTPEQADALQEMLIENRLFVYEEDGNYYRLRLTQSNYNINEEEATPNYLEFTVERALAPRNYMRLRSMTDGAPTEQQWLANDNGFWALNTGGGFWQLN